VQVAVSLTAVRELSSRGFVAPYVAGHSLGDLTACAAAGAFADENAVGIAALRGNLMARESDRHPGRMLSIRASSEEADEALAIASSAGAAVIAARNSPDDYLLSGSDAAMRAVPARFSPASVHTGGAWHSPAMAGAVDEFRSALMTRCGNASHSTWLANRTGDVVAPTEDVIPLLVEALTLPIRWYDVMKRMQSLGVRKFVTVGPSRALRIFARKTLGTTAVIISVETPDDLSRASDALGI
jgi:[acyl-carrier-protein] S-malonyltransferase